MLMLMDGFIVAVPRWAASVQCHARFVRATHCDVVMRAPGVRTPVVPPSGTMVRQHHRGETQSAQRH
uniref:Putative secreted protein n=1 Tax=Anopheles darlingi TaxID=43151 RepID=A0A2M4DMP5_ANODA